jgi:hypothetical protein
MTSNPSPVGWARCLCPRGSNPGYDGPRPPWLTRWGDVLPERRRGLSWPVTHIKGLGRSLRAVGQPYVFVAEEGQLAGGMKRRVLRYLFLGAVGRNGSAHGAGEGRGVVRAITVQ